jgi:hypothetical protein
MPGAKNSPQSSQPTYDYSGWPIFVIRMPPRALSPDALRIHLIACREPFLRGQPFCMLIDMGDHPALPASQRKAVGEAMKADTERYPGLQIGMAIVVRSALARGVMTAINWIARTPFAFAAFDDEGVARRWLLDRLSRKAAAAAPGP